MIRRWLSSRSARPAEGRRPLAIDALEDRTVPSAVRTIGGLEFVTAGQFVATPTPAGTREQADGPVQVGLAPAAGADFVPLVRFADGVSFVDGDSTGSFTGRGVISAIVGGRSIDLAGAADRDLSASGLLTGAVALADGNGVSVAGAEFTPSAFELAGGAVELQGDLKVAALAGLDVAVRGDDFVAVDAGGVRLTGLDVGLSDLSFERAGFGFRLNDANVHYSLTDNEFDVTGDGSIQIAGREVGVRLAGDGLIVRDGQVEGISATITAPEIAFGSVTLESAGLGLEYSRADDSFNLHGSAELDAAGMRLGIDLGAVELENGQLTHLDAAVDGNFQVMGITVEANHLGVDYDATEDKVEVYGGAYVSSPGGVFGYVGATLGTDADHAGLVIWQGQVQDVDIDVDGTVKVGGMSLRAKDLSLRYDVPTGELQLVGGLGLSLAGGRIQASAELTGDGFTFDREGNAQVSGLKFTADGDLGAVQVHGLDVEYTKAGGVWYASGTVQLGNNIQVGGSFTIKGGKLTQIALSYNQSPGIALGDTGLFLTHVGGSITNLDSPTNINASIDATVVFGRTVTFLGNTYSLFTAHGKVTATKDELKLDGRISMCNGYMGSGTASVDLNWAAHQYTVGYDVTMFYGTFRRQGTMGLYGTSAVYMDGKCTLQAPAAIRSEFQSFGLPTQIAEADFRLNLDRYHADQNYAAATFTAIGGLTFTVRYGFDDSVSLTVLNGLHKILTKAVDAAGKAVTSSFDAANRLATQTIDDGVRVVTNEYTNAVLTYHEVDQTVVQSFGQWKMQMRQTLVTVYDAGGRFVETVDVLSTMAGQELQRVTTDAVKTVTEFLDSAGRVTKRVTDEAGKEITETFDSAGHKISSTAKKVGDALNPTNWF